MILPATIWWNTMVCQRERPSQMLALMMALYGAPGAQEAMDKYFADYDSWRAKWAPLDYGFKDIHV